MPRVKVEVEPTRSALATAMLNSKTTPQAARGCGIRHLKCLCPGLCIASPDHLVKLRCTQWHETWLVQVCKKGDVLQNGKQFQNQFKITSSWIFFNYSKSTFIILCCGCLVNWLLEWKPTTIAGSPGSSAILNLSQTALHIVCSAL